MTKAQPEATGSANIALDYIGKLYDIERELRQRKVLPTTDEWLDARQQKSVPVITQFKAWLKTLAPKLPPSTKLAKAVHYALGQWSKLSVCLIEPIVPLDNNRCENAIRPFVVGRKVVAISATPKQALQRALVSILWWKQQRQIISSPTHI